MKKLTVLICLAVVVFAGCTAMYAGFIGADAVMVYDAAPIDIKYRVISIVYGQDELIEDVIRDIKIKARKIHADAVILQMERPAEPVNREPTQPIGNNNQIVVVKQEQSQRQSQGYGSSFYSVPENGTIIIKALAIRYITDTTAIKN